MTEEEMEFWKEPQKVEEERDSAEEIDEKLIGEMKLKTPKPVFNTPTKCKVVELKFFKVDKIEKNQKNDGEYNPFFATLTLKEIGGKEIIFKENLRGGRIYNTPEKGMQTYIGPTSSLGKFKAICIDNKINIGNSLKEWAANIVGLICTVKAETVVYLGKKYDKNSVLAIQKE
jgi:hypothetical protein